MKWIVLAILFLCGMKAFAGSVPEASVTPKKDPIVQREFDNVYQAIKNPTINSATVSSMTVKNVSVSTITLVSSATIASMNVSTATVSSMTVSGIVTFSSVTIKPGNGTAFTAEMCGLENQFTITAVTSTAVTAAFVRTGLSGTLTPHSTSSYVKLNACGEIQNSAAANTTKLTLERNTSNLAGTSGFGQAAPNGSGAWRAPQCIHYIDSPASTSALTYEVYMQGTAGTTSFCANNETCVLTIQECIAMQ